MSSVRVLAISLTKPSPPRTGFHRQLASWPCRQEISTHFQGGAATWYIQREESRSNFKIFPQTTNK
jgi:hypothetical protein